jgi:hypothetical protein
MVTNAGCRITAIDRTSLAVITKSVTGDIFTAIGCRITTIDSTGNTIVTT